MKKILNVFRKEKTDFLRDKRTVLSSLAFALFGPLVLVFALNFVAEKATDDTPTALSVVGVQLAPNLVNYLAGQGVEVRNADAGGTVDEQLADSHVLLVITEEFAEHFSGGLPATLNLYVDRTSQMNSVRAQEISSLIAGYGAQIRDMRMLANGMPSALATPIILRTGNIADAGGKEKQFATMMLYFFLFAPFFSSLGAAIDTTAGERERRSLQSLLAQPVSTRELIFGKWLVAAAFGTVGTVISVIGGVYAFEAAPLDVLGISLKLDIPFMLANLVPFALLVAAVQVLIALNAKSFKEANTQLQILTFVPALVGMFFMMSDKAPEGFASYLPIVGQMQTMQAAAIGGSVEVTAILMNALVAFALAAVCLDVAARKLGGETMLKAA